MCNTKSPNDMCFYSLCNSDIINPWIYDKFAYPENICKLPCEWPHTSYDIKYWNFEYNINNINNDWYVKHIKNIYEGYSR